MIQNLKRTFYFLVAWHFRILAEIRLRIWNPRVIVVTGSSGKTTLLHLIESQLGSIAKYSHHANSSIGIPFDILGLKREKLTIDEWPLLFIKSPFKLFTPLPKEKIYVVEADCDRPYEGRFLSSLLKPEVVLWISSTRTHSMNFESLVGVKFKTVEEAIAHEFGYFAESAKKLVVIDGDNPNEVKESSRSSAKIEKIDLKHELKDYTVSRNGTEYSFTEEKIKLPYLLPKEAALGILMSKKLLEYLNIKWDSKFADFKLPPARSSIFQGIKGVTIIDSTYNANLDSMKAIIEMYLKVPGPNKWAVLGDMLEQGVYEEDEHKKLAEVINKYNFEKLILMGPRIKKYTFPHIKQNAEVFTEPKDVLNYIEQNINGGEIILFKGARFLEGVIEHLLKNKSDAAKLSRREKIWDIRRKKWGL